MAVGEMLRPSATAAGALLSAPGAAAEDRPRAFSVGGTYVSDSFGNLSGGTTRGIRQMGLLELTAETGESLFGIDGAHGYASVQLVHGKSLSGDLVGDSQIVSNIDAPDGLRLFEAWMSVPVAGDGYVKAGLIDLNGEFDVQSVGGLFVNSSHGIGPDFSQSGVNGPSIFPTSSTAVTAGWNEDRWAVRIGLFDAVSGNPDHVQRTVIRFPGTTGLLMVAEAEMRVGRGAKLQVGAWGYTSEFDPIEPSGRRRGNSGAYAMFEGRVGQFASQPLDGWIRVGTAETEFNPIGLYLGGGVAAGPEESRFGLAVAHARLGRPAFRKAAQGAADRAETIVELTHARAVGDRLVVQPNLQYVINPGWDARLGNALVAGARLQLTLF